MKKRNQQPNPRARLARLYARCHPPAGKPGGLVVEEADEFQRLADALGVVVEWTHYDLKTMEWKEGRGQP